MRSRSPWSCLLAALLVAIAVPACGGGGGKRTQAVAPPRTTTTAEGATTVAPEAGGTSALPPATTARTTSPGGTKASGGGVAATTTAPSSGAPAPAPAGPGVRTGVTATEVRFGMHLPRSGAVGALVGNLWHGADAYFRSVNDAGGVHGRKIRLVLADDRYAAEGASSAIRELEADGVFAASGPAGVDQVTVAATYANRKGIPYFSGGTPEAFLADKPWAFPVTASYPYGAARLMDYLFTKKGYTASRKIGVLYLNSDFFTKETIPAARTALRRYGAGFAVEEPAEKDQSDFSAAVLKFMNAKVDTLWFATDPTLIAKFTAQAKAVGFRPQYVFMPPMGGDLYALAAGGNLDGAFGLATSADPEWGGAAGFRSVFARYYPNEQPSEFTLLAYVIAQVFVEGLRRAGPDLGRDAFARAIATIDHLDTGISSPLDYKTRSREKAGNSTLAEWRIVGTRTDQTTGFAF